jgi:hypothetical protein
MRKQKKILVFLLILLVFLFCSFNSNFFGIFLVEKASASGSLSCSLTPFTLAPGNDVTISATVGFTASSVWTVITNDGATINTQTLTSGDGVHYSKTITTSSSYVGKNNVAVYATKTSSNDTYVCNPSDGSSWVKKSVSSIPWQGRRNHQTVVFNGKMYMMGGYLAHSGDGLAGGHNYANDVWSSTDGLNWIEETSSAPWAGRSAGRAIVFNNKIWLMGGLGDAGLLNDIWSSSDGKNWTEESSGADWSARTDFGITIYDSKIWISGGCDALASDSSCSNSASDVWYSSDGTSWTRATASAPFSVNGHGMTTFNDELWVMGGVTYPGGAVNNHIYNSTDGINWSLVTPGGSIWSAREGFGSDLLVFDDGGGSKMWVMGGEAGGTPKNDVWSTPDGINWTQVKALTAPPGPVYQPSKWVMWAPRDDLQALVYNDGSGSKMWVLGGRQNLFLWNDVWKSSDGSAWNLVGTNYEAEYGRRFNSQLIGFDNKLWLFGGITQTGSTPIVTQDVWSSTDGFHWTCEVGPYTTGTEGIGCNHTVPGTFWSARQAHKVVVYNDGSGDKLWLIGGCSSTVISNCPNGYGLNDVWSSSDGINWTQETASAAFPARYDFEAAAYNNKLWLMGGINSSGTYFNDVWSSSDGSTWTHGDDAAWSARAGIRAVVFNNGSGDKLWVMGGWDGTRKNDVWYSTDPGTSSSWTEATASASWEPRVGFALLNYNGRMYIFGGTIDPGFVPTNVWSSSDGISWSEDSNNAEWDGRDWFGYTVFKNQMWLVGGDALSGRKADVWASKIGTYFIVTSNPTGQILITAEVVPTLTLTLSSNTCDLGTFDPAKIKTCNYNTQVSTNGADGYVAFIRSDGQLRSGSNNIADVSGSTISTGSEGYGVSTTESEAVAISKINDANIDGLYNQDDCTAMNDNTISANASVIDTSDKSFAKSLGPVSFDTVYLCHAAAISAVTPAGSYSQQDTITVVSNF